MRTLPLLMVLMACQPTFNWRETRLDDSALAAMMPCKPERMTRQVPFVNGATVEMTVASCEAGGVTFALSTTDVQDPAQVARVLTLWRDVVQRHWQYTSAASVAKDAVKPFALPQSTPLASSVRLTGTGRNAQGADMAVDAAFFAQGSRVFQVALIAQPPKALTPEVAEMFYGGLKLQ